MLKTEIPVIHWNTATFVRLRGPAFRDDIPGAIILLREDSEHLKRHSRRFAVRVGVAEWLQRRTWPRLAMAVIVLICVGVGVGASILLRQMGLTGMWLRYPVALIAAYAAFLLLLGSVIAYSTHLLDAQRKRLFRDSQRHQHHSEDTGRPDLGDVFDQFFETIRNSNNGNGDARSTAALLLVILAATVVLICVYFVCVAPAFLAELIVEGACLTWLYQPRDRTGLNQWHAVALEQTALPALMMAFSLMVIGIGLQISAPRAETAVEAWKQIRERPKALAVQNGRIGF